MTSYAPVYRVQLVREGRIERPEEQLRAPSMVAGILSQYLDGTDREHFVVILLDTKNRIIGINTVSVGILDSALVHPREVFKPAILANASSVIVGHNHPSGDPAPSEEDKRVTLRLSEAGQLLGIEVLDSLIIGDEGRFVSLKERGIL